MEVVIQGTREEIAALVLAVQERRQKMISVLPSGPMTDEDRKKLADSIRSYLLVSSSVETQSQQPDSTGHKQKGGNLMAEWYEPYKNATQKETIAQALEACSRKDCTHCLYQGKGIKCAQRLLADAAKVIVDEPCL